MIYHLLERTATCCLLHACWSTQVWHGLLPLNHYFQNAYIQNPQIKLSIHRGCCSSGIYDHIADIATEDHYVSPTGGTVPVIFRSAGSERLDTGNGCPENIQVNALVSDATQSYFLGFGNIFVCCYFQITVALKFSDYIHLKSYF